MSTDNTKPNWTARTSGLLAVVLAVVGGLWLLDKANRDTEPTVVATSCRGFAADARKLFDKGDTVALIGAFAPGDRVSLAIDFEGVGYAWELTGVLAHPRKAEVTGADSSAKHTRVVSFFTSTRSSSSTVTSGHVTGFARLDVEADVATAGDGAILIVKTGSVPSFRSPRVASASCDASKKPTTRGLSTELR
jgi:hypothetical protein